MRNTPLFTAALLLLFAVPASAAPPASSNVISSPALLSGVSQPGDTPAQAFRHALFNLRAGGPYLRAIRQLQFCTARDPKNRAYHLALGCAYADRAASVGYASMWTATLADDRAQHPQALKDWQKEHPTGKVSERDAYFRPTLPPDRVFLTKDDAQPFTLPVPQAAALVGTLSQSAQAEWKRAVALSRTPTERADAEWVQGVGLRLLVLAAQGRKDAPTDRDAVNALSAATHDAPQNAVCWQSLGDALRPSDRDKSNAPARAAYHKSLDLQPLNAPLWFRLYLSQVKWGRDPQPEAEAALRHVVDSDPDNAYPHYLLAALLFRRTHFSDINGNGPEGVAPALAADYDAAQYKDAGDALSEIEAGNTAPRYAVPEYVPPTPELLTAFDIWRPTLRALDNVFGQMVRLRELARAASGYGRISAAHGDKAVLERGAQAAIGMGAKMSGGWPLRDTPGGGSEVITALVGFAVTSIGYSSLVKGYAQMGDAPASQAAQADWDTFKARQDTWRKAHEAATHGETEYDDY